MRECDPDNKYKTYSATVVVTLSWYMYMMATKEVYARKIGAASFALYINLVRNAI